MCPRLALASLVGYHHPRLALLTTAISPLSPLGAAVQRLLQVSTKIIGVSTNYMVHVKEPGNVPKVPTLFLKPTSSFLHAGAVNATIEVPEPLESLRHEAEFAVIISRRARDVPEASAMDYVEGYALALDMTAKELQLAAKVIHGLWQKDRDTFTPISAVIPKSAVTDPHDLELWLKVDDELRQKGSTGDMIFKIPYLVSYISSIMTLMEGDVILTGTPAGTGPVRVGQKIKAGITGFADNDMEFDVQRRERLFST
ncbi:acylpyruvase FAHD1, mitochondrial-like isoform X2 [Panicum miliaceum]|uniref:Acylpyruvase FAHD1, mitochondrial-like isoform X2 n=1 Tax=Panicum miliaceum TaxID=4540 RepID=A0A3L6QYE2_PANMI|nr:acylpyruvase FAHD1, mitochondrial-like isoform X2 [Panicum miliaceum]